VRTNIHIPTCMSDSFKEIHAAGQCGILGQ
jgi:hypothetical protein